MPNQLLAQLLYYLRLLLMKTHPFLCLYSPPTRLLLSLPPTLSSPLLLILSTPLSRTLSSLLPLSLLTRVVW